MSTFELLPAIDLRGGRVVRLRKGDFAAETVFGDDPLRVARAFVAQGAEWLHVVDLDGARDGEPRQLDLGLAIVAALGAPGSPTLVELAGGLRTRDAAGQALAAGAARIVLGTAALRDPGFARDLVGTHGADRIAVAIDIRGEDAVGEGWRPDATSVRAGAAIARLADAGVVTFEVTAIERDGLLQGPDLDRLGSLVGLRAGRIIASGGISSIADLVAVRDLGCSGAIVGRAILDGTLDLRAALAAIARGADSPTP